MSLSEDQKDYLLRRFYSEQDLQAESPFSIGSGYQITESIETNFQYPRIGFLVRTMSGEILGLHILSHLEKDYRFFRHPKAYLSEPTIYGTERDFELMYQTGTLILCEGLFDRIAVKRVLPFSPVLARMSKGVSKHLVRFIHRYVRVLHLAFDTDAAGIRAADLASSKLLEYKTIVTRLTIYGAKDPSAFLEKYGMETAKKTWEADVAW